jgi:hypothetical protein
MTPVNGGIGGRWNERDRPVFNCGKTGEASIDSCVDTVLMVELDAVVIMGWEASCEPSEI